MLKSDNDKLRVLFTTPNATGYDRTVYYRFTFFGEVFEFVRNNTTAQVELFDGSGGGYTKKDYIKLLTYNTYDLIVIWCEYVADVLETIKLFHIIKDISAETKVLVYGDGPIYVPQLFKYYGFDAIRTSGDPELAVCQYIRYIEQEEALSEVSNLDILTNGCYFVSGSTKVVNPADWAFPPLDDLPLDNYKLYVRNKGSFEKTLSREDVVAVSVSKGCMYNCKFCATPMREGIKDRRRPIDVLVKWLQQVSLKHNLVHLMSPIFTEDKEWVKTFCNSMVQHHIKINWKISTRPEDLLDRELIKLMAKAGCESISFGVETLYKNQSGRSFKSDLQSLKELSDNLKLYGIHGKAYIMLGMPKQTREDILFTIDTLKHMGLLIRPTGYTPFYDLTTKTVEELLNTDLESYDRRTFFNPTLGLTKKEFYKIILRDY